MFFRKNIVKTSHPKWLLSALKHYTLGKEFLLLDDAALGIEKSDVESGLLLIKKTQKLNISWNQIAEITKRIGICSVSLAIIGYSIADVSPYGKLDALLSSNSMLILPKSLHTLKTLAKRFNVAKIKNEFRIVYKGNHRPSHHKALEAVSH